MKAPEGVPEAERAFAEASFKEVSSAHFVTKFQLFDMTPNSEGRRVAPPFLLALGNSYQAPVGPGGNLVTSLNIAGVFMMETETLQSLVNALAKNHGIRATE